MSSEEKDEGQTINLKVKIPTKETIVKSIANLFPGIEVEVVEEKKEEERPPE